MGRPKVKHCRECIYLDSYEYTDTRVRPSRSSHRCKLADRHITGQEVRTSPRWCPLNRRFVWR